MRSGLHTGRTRSGLLLAVLASLACACSGDGRRGAAPRNVLLVTIDTLRADHVGAYGATGVATPTLDRLAAEGTRASLAYSVAPLTLPSHATILTGLLPPRHGIRHNALYRLDPQSVTLAERLREHGLRTGAVVGAFVLDSRYGLDQGFESYDDEMSDRKAQIGGFEERPADRVTDRAIAWLEAAGEPFFLWVHYFDPHASYVPPAPWDLRFADRLYDGEIAFVDAELGRLLAALEAAGRYDDTLIVVTADHGESLGEHGEPTHSYTLYDASLSVPWILRGPRVPAGAVVEGVTSIADTAPTVLALAGATPLDDVDGLDLSASWRGRADEAYAETLATRIDHGWAPLHALRSERHLYVEAPRPELYDSRSDPRQIDNLLEGRPGGEHAALRDGFVDRLGELLSVATAGDAVRPDEETLERLRSLGYAIPSAPVAESGTDPKDGLRWAGAFAAASDLYKSGRREEAGRALADLEEQLPASGRLQQLLAQVAIDEGDFTRAISHAERAVQLSPRSAYDWMMLGYLQEMTGRTDESLATYARAAELDPDLARVQLGLMRAAARARRIEDAERHARRVRERISSGEKWVQWWEVGERWQEIGLFDRAAAIYAEAVLETPGVERMHMLYAIALVHLGRAGEARAQLEQAGDLAASPNLANLLGVAYASKGLLDEAERSFRRALASAPGDPAARANLARLEQFRKGR